MGFLWRGGLPPFGCAAVVMSVNAVCLSYIGSMFQGRFATQREQAPSPQKLYTAQASAVSITIIKQNPISSPRLASLS
ncbi:hypothetical protein J2Y86_004367 [Pseudomonas migulae]|nr:hypothetical protein [Pseudomonas migulae]